MMRLFFLTLFLIGCGKEVTAESLPQTLTLKNGFQIVFQKRTASPLVALELWVRAGAREERNAENGAAHFIEHLVFRRDRKAKTESPDTAIENLGATLAAANAPDYTRYTTTVAAAHFGKAVAILSDVVRNAEFPAEELELERGVILDELAIRENNVAEQIQNTLYRQLFPNHPYRFSPGGEADSIKTISRETLLSFYRRNYRSHRCILVVVGNVEAETVRAEATQVFGNWITPQSLPNTPETESPTVTSQPVTLYRRSVVPQLGMGYIAPPGANPLESYASLLLANILEARLQNLPTLSEITVKYTPRLSSSLFQIQATLDVSDTKLAVPLDIQDRYARAENFLRNEMKRLQTTPPTQTEMTQAARQIVGRYLVDTETNSGLAQFTAYAKITADKIGWTPMEALAAIRPANIKQAARTILAGGEGIVHLLPDRSPLPKKEAKP